VIGSHAASLAHERSCMREMTRKLHEHIRRKAQETTGKEETMTPKEALATLINDWPSVYLPPEVIRAYDALKAHIEATTPWLPPRQQGFGPWIEWKPGDLGPRVTDQVLVILAHMRDKRIKPEEIKAAPHWTWRTDVANPIVAYCVKLPDADGKFAGRKNAFENGCGND
jgi:hypothetical protein